MPIKHYVIVRDDLPIGTLAAMVVHAAGISSNCGARDAHAVVLAVTGSEAIRNISRQLAAAGINHHGVNETDSPWNGEFMAIGIPPAASTAALRSVTRQLRLLQ